MECGSLMLNLDIDRATKTRRIVRNDFPVNATTRQKFLQWTFASLHLCPLHETHDIVSCEEAKKQGGKDFETVSFPLCVDT